MSRNFYLIGGALLLVSYGCNSGALEPGSTNDDSLVKVEMSDLTYFMSTNLQDPHRIQIAAVNQQGTMCLDGEVRPSCEIGFIDFSHADMEEDTADIFEPSFLAGKGLIFGWMQLAYSDEGELVPTLYALEGWIDPTPGYLATTVYEVHEVDLWCVRAPCPKYQVEVVNLLDTTLLHEVDLYTSQAPEEMVEEGYSQLASDHILVGGVIKEYIGGDEAVYPLPGTLTLTSDTFYLRVMNE